MHSVLTKCNCDLDELYSKVECTILYLIRKKHAIAIYNLGDKIDEERFKDLIIYKRILGKRKFDCDYPKNIKTSDLIAKVSQLAFRGSNCSECENC